MFRTIAITCFALLSIFYSPRLRSLSVNYQLVV